MKPYWRAESKRIEAFETRSGWLESRLGEAWQAPVLRVVPRATTAPEIEKKVEPTFDAAGFAASFEAALGVGDGALMTLSRCAAWTVAREFGCGAERSAAKGWCGSSICGPCAEARATEAASAARARWSDARVIVADIPLGVTGKLKLPAPAAVLAARDGWARATKQAPETAKLEGLPRAITHPDGLRVFAQPPVGVEGAKVDALAKTLEAAMRQVGLKDTVVRVVSRDQAAKRLADALTLEARRFQETVTADLRARGRFSSASIGWVEHARSRQKDARRALVSGGRDALPVSEPRGPALEPTTCPTHGAGCAETAAVVRDAKGVVVSRAKPLAAKPTRQAFAALVTTKPQAAKVRKAG